jgi:peptidoglycan/xylan/chitin deacetylase (PgdA/CDA1 family)
MNGWERPVYWAERCAIELLYRTGISHVTSHWDGGCGAIYLFHSATPERYLHIDRDIRTSPQFLDRLLLHLRASGIDVISMDAVPLRLKDGNRRRFVAITFDDGYGDNFVHALPVFEKHGAPLTIYVTTAMLTGSFHCWWLGLEHLFLRHSIVEIAPMQRTWRLQSLRSRARAYRETRNWIIADVRSRSAALAPTFARYGIDLAELTRKAGLNHDQLRALARHPLVTIGGHTTNHPDLSQLPDSEAYGEIVENKRFLEAAIDTAVNHFAYPFGTAGTCGQREAALARRAGYHTATTTFHQCLTNPLSQDLMLLPRVGINRPYECIGLARLQIDGTLATFRRLKARASLRRRPYDPAEAI